MHFVFVYGITIKQSDILLDIIYAWCAGVCCKYFLIKSRCRGKSCEWGMTPSITTQHSGQPDDRNLIVAAYLSSITHPSSHCHRISNIYTAQWPSLDLWHSASVVRRGAWRVRSVASTTTTTTPGHSVQLRSHASPHHWHTVLHFVGELGQ